jgi:multidrug efflux pump subunit AcrA (membrane-fusion protein)
LVWLHWWTVGRFFESTDDAYVGGDVTAISPHVAGFISEVLVNDNQYVQAGQPLIRLDVRDFQAAADHAAAVLGQRKAALDSLRARESLQQSTIRQAVSDLDAKVAQADFAKEEEERYRTHVLSSAGTARDAHCDKLGWRRSSISERSPLPAARVTFWWRASLRQRDAEPGDASRSDRTHEGLFGRSLALAAGQSRSASPRGCVASLSADGLAVKHSSPPRADAVCA